MHCPWEYNRTVTTTRGDSIIRAQYIVYTFMASKPMLYLVYSLRRCSPPSQDTSRLRMRYEQYHIFFLKHHCTKSSPDRPGQSNMAHIHHFGAARAAQAAYFAGEEAATPPRPRPAKTTGQLQHLEAGTLRKAKDDPRPALRDRLRKAVDKLRCRPKQEAGPSCYERIASRISGPVLHDPVLNSIVTITLAEAQARAREDPTGHAFL